MNGAIPPLPKGAKMVDDQVPPLPPGAKMLNDLPSVDSKPKEAPGYKAYNWLFGIGDEYKDKGLITHDLPEYGKKVSKERESARSSKDFFDKVQKRYEEQVASISKEEKDPARRRQLLMLAKEERDNRLGPGADAMVEQFAPKALGTASKMLEGVFTPSNVGAGAVAAKFPMARPLVGAYYGVEAARGLHPREPGEDDATFLERILMGLSGVAGGGAIASATHLPPVSDTYRTKKLTYATGDTPPESIKEVLPDLIEQARKQGKPKRGGEFGGQSVKDVQKYVDKSLEEKNVRFNTELQGIGDMEMVPTTVAQEIKGLIKPNWANTEEGAANIEEINRRAAEFEKPWSLRALNAERMDSYGKTKSYKAKSTAAKMKTSPDLDLDIEKAIERSTKDLVYDTMGKQKSARLRAQGAKPEQVAAAEEEFRELKKKQSALLDIKSHLDDHVKKITAKTYSDKGKPFTAGQTATISAHPGGVTPRMHGLGRFFGREPLSAASKASRQAFKRLPKGPSGAKALPPVTGQGETIERTPEPPKKAKNLPEIKVAPAEVKGVTGKQSNTGYTGEERRGVGRNPTSRISEFRKELRTETDPEKIEELKASIEREIAFENKEPSKPIPHKNLPTDEDFAERAKTYKPVGEYNRETKKVEPHKELPGKPGGKKAANPDSLKPWLDKATAEWQAANPGKKVDFKAIEKRALEMKKQAGLTPIS